MQFIEWCNENNGFLTAILSMLTLFVSIVAIVVSIQTARLPYKRRISTSVEICVSSQVVTGFSVSATNTGNRNINIMHFGLAYKDGPQLIPYIRNGCTLGEKSIVIPAEEVSVTYSLEEVVSFLSDLPHKTRIYSYAYDAEWRRYKKRYNTVGNFLKEIERFKNNEIMEEADQNN